MGASTCDGRASVSVCESMVTPPRHDNADGIEKYFEKSPEREVDREVAKEIAKEALREGEKEIEKEVERFENVEKVDKVEKEKVEKDDVSLVFPMELKPCLRMDRNASTGPERFASPGQERSVCVKDHRTPQLAMRDFGTQVDEELLGVRVNPRKIIVDEDIDVLNQHEPPEM